VDRGLRDLLAIDWRRGFASVPAYVAVCARLRNFLHMPKGLLIVVQLACGLTEASAESDRFGSRAGRGP
jgi:hypothetical protein